MWKTKSTHTQTHSLSFNTSRCGNRSSCSWVVVACFSAISSLAHVPATWHRDKFTVILRFLRQQKLHSENQCRKKYAGKHTRTTVTVNISRRIQLAYSQHTFVVHECSSKWRIWQIKKINKKFGLPALLPTIFSVQGIYLQIYIYITIFSKGATHLLEGTWVWSAVSYLKKKLLASCKEFCNNPLSRSLPADGLTLSQSSDN